MQRITKKLKQITAAASVVSAIVAVLLIGLLSPNTLTAFQNEIFFIVILVILVPSAFLDLQHQRWISSIEDQMPLLVRGVAESQETGMTLIKALEKVVDNKMVSGPLAKEVKQMVVQMAWGTSFEDALTNFKNRINSPIVNRFAVLVLEASHSGGTIKKVFTATSGFMEEMKELDRDTSAQMKPYTIVVYAAFVVFIVTAILLVTSFFAPMEGSQQIMGNAAIGGVGNLKDFFYKNMMVSALTGGLMAGKLGERRVAGGLKHSIILVVVGFVIFLIGIPPTWIVTA
jgi:archaeal flagellar protein FlaJ